MNKIFKVVWSKSKQCYVVVSEIAKNTTGKKKIIVAAILAGLATQGCNVMAAGAGTPAESNNVWGKATPGGVAIGSSAVASGASAVDPATGVARVAPSIAIGLASTSSGLDTITIGIGAGNSKSYGISMGKRTNVGGDYGVALGYEASAMSDHAVAIGEQTRAPKMGATVMGVSARGYGQGSVSLGWQALAGADVYGSGININTNPYSDTKPTIDNYAKWGDTAIGLRAVATGGNATALGRSARAAAENAIAIGGGDGNNFNNNTEKTEATASKAIAMGYNAKASNSNALSLGVKATASGLDSVSFGTGANASNTGAIGIGKGVTASGSDSVSLGTSSKASDSGAIAIGETSESTDTNSVALGYTSKANGASATAIGPQSQATKTSAVALGRGATATEEYAVAIGDSASAIAKNSVALGYKSKADTASGVAGYDVNANRTNKYAGLTGNALTSSWGAVSIGDGTNTRQITGLAAGTNDTDAVNVAQLKSVNLAFTGDNSSSGDVNLANSKLAVTGDNTYITTAAANQGLVIKAKKETITVSNGTASASIGVADARNVADSINQANADQKISYKANVGTTNSVKLTDGFTFTDGTSTIATVGNNGQVTYDLNAAIKKSIADSETAVKRTISLGADSGARSSQSLNDNNVEFNIKGGTGSFVTTSMSGGTVTVNTTKGTIQSDTAGTASVSGADGLATAQNVATAINKAKEGSAWDLAVNTGASQKVAGGTKVTFKDGKNIALTQTGTTITVGTTSQLTADAVTVGTGANQIVLNGTTGEVSGKSIKTGNSTLNTGGLTISGGPSVTSTGINAGNTVISGVSQGVAGTDAVNKSQMDAAVKAVADSTSDLGKNTITLAAQSGSTTGQALNSASGIKFYINGESGSDALISTSASGTNVSVAATQKLKDAVTQAANAANKDLSNLSTAGDTHIKDLAKTAATWNVSTNGSNNTAVAGGETVNFVNGDNVAITNTGRNITIGTAKNVSFDKVTVGGVTIDKTDGINAGGTEIKGIADATAADSAVSKGQMDAAIANAQTTATSTEKVVAKTLTGDNNLATVTGQTGTAKNETYEVAVSENAVKAVAANAAQDAVKVAGTGLATVSDATTGGVKTYTVNVEEGKLVLDDATGNVGAAGSTQGTTAGKDGVATTQNVAKAINDAVTKANANNAQALADAEHKFDGDTGTTSVRKHGEVLSIKGGVTTPADLTTGNIGVVSDGAGTLNVRLAKVLTGLTSATYSDGNGNTQTVTGASSTITDGAGKTTTMTKGGLSTTDGKNTTKVAPTGITATDGTHTVKVEGSGINAGGTEIKGIADATAADSAVSKGQMDTAIANAQTAATSTEKVVAKTLTGDNNLATVTGQTGTAKNETYEVAVSENAVKAVAANAAQDAVKVAGTGLATVSDATTGGVKTYTVNVEEGKLVLDDATGNVGAAGSTQGTTAGKDGVATTQNVAKAINDAVTKANANNAQALADAEHKFDGDTGTTSVRKHGEVLSIKGGVTTPADLTTGNIGVVSDGAGTLNVRLAKVLTGLTSATYSDGAGNTQTVTGTSSTITDGAGKTTSMTKDGLSTTDGKNTTKVAPTGVTATDGTHTVKVEGSGINAGGTEIKGIADATAADSAVSKGQMDTAIANAQTAATSTEKVVAKTLTGDNNLATVTGQTGTAKNETYEVAVSENAVKAVAANAAQDAVKVAGTGLATVSDATTGGVKTYTVNVEEGKLVLDDATGNVGAAGSTQGTTAGKDGVATTQNVAKAINDAVTKANANNAQALADAEHKFDGDTGTTSVRKHGEVLSIKGGVTTPADLTTGNIGVVSDGAGTLNVRLAKVLTGLTSATYSDGAGNTQTVTGTSSTITDGAGKTTSMTKDGLSTTDGKNTTTVAPNGMTATDGTHTVKVEGSGIDAGNTELKNVAAGTAATSAVNKQQMEDAISKATGDATHEFGGDDTTVVSRKHGEKLNIKGGASTSVADLTDGNIAVIGDATTGTLNLKLAKVLTGLTSATYTDAAGNTTTVTGGTTTIADAAGNTQTLAPTKSEIKDNAGVSTVTTKDGVTAKDGNGNTTALTKGGVSATDGNGHTTDLTKGGLSTTDGTNTTTVTPNGMTATDGTNTVKVEGSGIDAGNTEIKNVAAGTTNTSAVNKKQMDDAISKATGDATHEFGGDDTTVVSRKHGEKLNIKGGASTSVADLTDGNIAVLGDATTGTLNLKLAKVLTGLTSATYTDVAGNTTTVTGGSTTIADTAGNTQTLAPTKSEIKDNAGVSTVTTKDGVTAKDGNGNSTALTKGGVSATDGNGHTTDLTKGGLSTTDGTNTTKVVPTGITATDGMHTVKVEGTGIDAGNTEIKNVAAGTTATSAVNKGQMDDAISKATADATHEFGGDTGNTIVRKHGEVLSIKGGVTDATKLSDNNIGVVSDGSGTLNVKLAKDLKDLTSATFKDTAGNTTTVTPNGLTATDGTNTVKVNSSGIDAGNTEIKNVADGTTPHSAVNKNQLDTAVSQLQNATDNLSLNVAGDNGTGNVKLKDQALHINGTNGITTKANGQSVTVGLDDSTMNTINNTAALANNAAKKDLSNIDQAGKSVIKDTAAWNVKVNNATSEVVKGGDTVTFNDGHNITITNNGKDITVATKKEVTFDKVSVGGITIDKNADHISGVSSITGNGSGAPTMTFNAPNGSSPANVSMNSNLDMGGKQINNVGPATHPTDAVNKQQVDQAMKSLAGMADNAAKQYASKAGANAAALAALKPIQYDPLAPTQIMAGIGNYKSQTAVALGVAHYSNEDTMFNIGASLDSHDAMLNAGVTHKFGSSAERKNIPDRYKGGPISSIYVMQDEVSTLKEQNSQMQALLDKQSSENAAIVAENKMLREQNEEMQRKVDLILSKLQ